MSDKAQKGTEEGIVREREMEKERERYGRKEKEREGEKKQKTTTTPLSHRPQAWPKPVFICP